MRTIITILLITLFSNGLHAQDQDTTTTSFEALKLQAGEADANFKSGLRLEHLSGGVKLVFEAKDPAKNLKIDATTIDFHYDTSTTSESRKAESQMPSRMELSGDIVIITEGNTIRSQKATIYMETMKIHFIGHSEFSPTGNDSFTSSDATIDMKSGDIQIKDLNIPSFSLIPPKKVQK